MTVSIKADNLSEGNSGEVFLLRLSPVANTVDVDITEPVASILILESQCTYDVIARGKLFYPCDLAMTNINVRM